MKRKQSIYFLISLSILLFIGYACHTPVTLIESPVAALSTPVYPSSEVELPVMEMIVPYTPAPMEEVNTNIKDVTLAFSYRDINHVRTDDPRRFVYGEVEIINLPYFSDNDYAFPLPGAKVISPYAGRRKNHSGIDLKTFPNDTVVSAFDGVVRMAKSYAAYGNVVVVRHYNGLETVYSHNSKNLVKPGDLVKAGSPLALVGRTGRATTEHVHFETRINGQHFNPELVFNFETRQLRNKTLLCTKKNNRIEVSPVDPYPYHFARTHTKTDADLSQTRIN